MAFYNWILNLLTPIVKFIGKIHAPFSRKEITGADYYNLRDEIQIGDQMLTKTKGELSNLINPTGIKHLGTYVGRIKGGKVCYVAEAVGKGYVLTDLVTFMTTKDVLVICKPNFIEAGERDTFETHFQENIKRMLGTPYDYLFNKGDKALYCFEAGAKSLIDIRPNLDLACKEIVKGKRIYNEETFLDQRYFEVIFDSRERS